MSSELTYKVTLDGVTANAPYTLRDIQDLSENLIAGETLTVEAVPPPVLHEYQVFYGRKFASRDWPAWGHCETVKAVDHRAALIDRAERSQHGNEKTHYLVVGYDATADAYMSNIGARMYQITRVDKNEYCDFHVHTPAERPSYGSIFDYHYTAQRRLPAIDGYYKVTEIKEIK